MADRTEHDAAIKRARRRVKELHSFYVHLAIYLLVNVGLVLLDLIQGDGLQWAYWAVIGWGIGLVAHAMTVFFSASLTSSRWEARKLAQFTEEEERHLRGT